MGTGGPDPLGMFENLSLTMNTNLHPNVVMVKLQKCFISPWKPPNKSLPAGEKSQ